jgi:hypothetical protein
MTTKSKRRRTLIEAPMKSLSDLPSAGVNERVTPASERCESLSTSGSRPLAVFHSTTSFGTNVMHSVPKAIQKIANDSSCTMLQNDNDDEDECGTG